MGRNYSMENRAELRDRTRRRLVTAVTGLVLEHGSVDVTMADIATRADVAVRTVYNHFGSLDEILAAAMSGIATEFSEVAPEPVNVEETSSSEALRVLVRQWFEELETNDVKLAALVTIRGSEQLDRALAGARELRIRRFRAVFQIAENREELRVPVDDAVAVAYVLTGHPAWTALVRQLKLTTDEAAALVTRSLCEMAFSL